MKTTITLDPGHGGEQKVEKSSANRAVGPGGTLEKELTLSLGLAVQAVLKERGHSIHMTRESDENFGLKKRANKSRDKGSDVFVSIHFNGCDTPDVQGTETYYHIGAATASRRLAACVQKAVRYVTGLRDRGVKRANMTVLQPSEHAPCTACCLVEVSFLTDPREEGRLKSQTYIFALAAGLADGIEEYLNQLHLMPGSSLTATPEEMPNGHGSELEDGFKADIPSETGPSLHYPQGGWRSAVEPDLYRAPATDKAHAIDEPGAARIANIGQFAKAWSRRRDEIRTELSLEAVIGKDSRLPVSFLARGVECSRAVCLVEASGIDYRGRAGSWVGTGFIVGPNLLITNFHVLNSADVADAATAIFDFHIDHEGRPAPTRSYRLAPHKLFLTSPVGGGLDYSFVWVDGDPQDDYGAIEMFRGAFTADENMRANIVQHPNGTRKKVALQDNHTIVQYDEALLHYITDTEGGSSGSPVFDNDWRLIALHHASRRNTQNLCPPGSESAPRRLNEGIKISAIALDLELRLQDTTEAQAASYVLSHMKGADSVTGYFGALGRRVPCPKQDGVERIASAYRGSAHDVDVAFWNVEWFNQQYRDKVRKLAGIVADLNLDIWAFQEASRDAVEALVKQMFAEFGQTYAYSACEPDATPDKPSTIVMWNTKTVSGKRVKWPETILDRYLGLFLFESKSRQDSNLAPFCFNLIPVHLKTTGDERVRSLATQLLAASVRKMIDEPGGDLDWIIGGDFNAERVSKDLNALAAKGFKLLAVEDEAGSALIYLKDPKSIIDRIFLSPNMARSYGVDDFLIHAQDKSRPDYLREVSDHRPVLVRLNPRDHPQAVTEDAPPCELHELLGTIDGENNHVVSPAADDVIDDTLRVLKSNPVAFLRALADAMEKIR